jgi:hypothetical protein
MRSAATREGWESATRSRESARVGGSVVQVRILLRLTCGTRREERRAQAEGGKLGERGEGRAREEERVGMLVLVFSSGGKAGESGRGKKGRDNGNAIENDDEPQRRSHS